MRSAGYSGAPLIKKLGIKPGMKAAFLYAPQGYDQTLGPLPQEFNLLKRLGKEMDFIHFFAKERAKLLSKLPKLKQALTYDGTLWISWPKKASKVETDIDENVVREAVLNVGLVDVKIAAIDEVWSGLKFMYRIKDRP